MARDMAVDLDWCHSWVKGGAYMSAMNEDPFRNPFASCLFKILAEMQLLLSGLFL